MELSEQSENKVEATSHNLPLEKPADRPYLRSRILQLLSKADQEPDSEKRYAILDRVRNLSFKLRKQTGFGDWSAIGFAVGCAALLITGIFFALQREDFYQVIDRTSDFNHTLQQVHRGKVLAPAVMFWCEPQPFEAGHILTSFKFDYNPDKFCYSVSAFSLLRDAATCPVVPPNCWHTDCAHPMTDHILCNGKPQFN